jgi:hypothetical protein
MQRPQGTDLELAGIDRAVTDIATGFWQDHGRGAAPPDHILTVAPRLQLPARLAQAAMPLEGGGQAKALRTTGLHDGMAEIIGITQDHHCDARGGLELPEQVSGPCRSLPKRASHGLGLRGLGLQPDVPRDNLVTADQHDTHLLVPLHEGVRRGILPRGHRLYAQPPCGVLGIIDAQRDGLPRLRVQSPEPRLGLLAEDLLGVPPFDQEEVMDMRPVGRGIQIPIHGGDMAPTPHEGNGHDQPTEVRAIVPVRGLFQGLKQRVQGRGHVYDAAYGAISCSRWLGGHGYTRSRSMDGLPLLPRLSSPYTISRKICQLELLEFMLIDGILGLH